MSVCAPEVHDAMKRDERVWSSLAWVGVQDADTPYALTLRNCSHCTTTLVKAVQS